MSKKFNDKHEKKPKKLHDDEVSSQAKWGGIVILFIMIFSILGFAMLSGGSGVSSNSELPDELALQQFDNNGQIFWGAIKGGEQFVFLSIDGYDNREDLESLASQIKSKNFINLNVDSSFASDDSIYILEKALLGLKIDYAIKYDSNVCDSDSLVLTLNKSISGDCIVFNPDEGEEAIDTEILVYHLIK